MFPIRRAVLRVYSSPLASFTPCARRFTSFSPPAARVLISRKPGAVLRRWATNDAATNGENAPISKLQPTPSEEVESAIVEEHSARETQTESAGGLTDANTAQLQEQDSPVNDSPAGASDTFAESSDTSATGEAPAARFSGILNEEFRNRQDAESKYTPKRTVYVGNLFFDVTEDDLEKEFARFGKIESTKLIRDARGLSKGFGYIAFQTTDQATKAITSLNQQLFEGRRLSVQYATHDGAPGRSTRPRSRMNPPSKTLFIGNLSWEMTDRDLNDLFKGIKNVIDIRVAIDRRTGLPRGFAHADFLDVKSAMDAMKYLEDKETYGRKLKLDYSFSSSAAPRNQARDEAEV